MDYITTTLQQTRKYDPYSAPAYHIMVLNINEEQPSEESVTCRCTISTISRHEYASTARTEMTAAFRPRTGTGSV